MPLVGGQRRRPPLRQRPLVPGQQRVQLGQPGALGLQIASGQIAAGIPAGQLVGQGVAGTGRTPQLVGRLLLVAAGIAQTIASSGVGSGSRGGGGARSLGLGVGMLRRLLPLRQAGGQRVALAARPQPGGLAGIGDPPGLAAVGVQPAPSAVTATPLCTPRRSSTSQMPATSGASERSMILHLGQWPGSGGHLPGRPPVPPAVTTFSSPSPCSSRSSAWSSRSATTAPALQPSAAATARSYPGSASIPASTRRAPLSRSACAAGDSPSPRRSASSSDSRRARSREASSANPSARSRASRAASPALAESASAARPGLGGGQTLGGRLGLAGCQRRQLGLGGLQPRPSSARPRPPAPPAARPDRSPAPPPPPARGGRRPPGPPPPRMRGGRPARPPRRLRRGRRLVGPRPSLCLQRRRLCDVLGGRRSAAAASAASRSASPASWRRPPRGAGGPLGRRRTRAGEARPLASTRSRTVSKA